VEWVPVTRSQAEIEENCRYRPEGIDKTRITYIIELWGIVGKKGSLGQAVMNGVNVGRPGVLEIASHRVLTVSAGTGPPCWHTINS